ncbi:MAG: hypothetical protein Q7V56_07265 [Gammaproteobacteria bacterium]|nr:hypothetical protein [Gammaproteobacteria bacterium]
MTAKKYIPPMWDLHLRLDDGRKVARDKSLGEGKLIYHFLPWSYALAIFQHNRLRFSPVAKWTDPYEKAWCDLLFQRKDKLSGVRTYGQCWTKSNFDEPLWRMFAFNNFEPIVRISCHVGTLINAGLRFIEDNMGSLYIGNVQYQPEKNLHLHAKTILAGEHKDVSRSACKFLLLKRNAFSFENEVRMLWFGRGKQGKELFFPIEASIDISQVMTSPYATKADHELITKDLKPYGIKPVRSGILWKPKFKQ